MRVAAIDIGTNSVLLLIAERRGRDLVPVLERATITRLGRGVDKARALDPGSVRDTLACLEGYAADIARAGVERVGVVGTSAMRDAQGGDDFRARTTEILGVAPQVISGDEEAALTFAGALAGLDVVDVGDKSASRLVDEGEVLVFDLGGGSTEFIRGRGDTAARAMSLDIGSVRLTERHLASDPPRPDEIEAARLEARRALAALGSDFLEGAPRVVGVAGTVTTLAAHVLGVAPYDPAKIHGARIGRGALSTATSALAALTVAERRLLPAIDPRRADVIVAGALVVDEILAWSGAGELLVSDRGVRWGLARRLAE